MKIMLVTGQREKYPDPKIHDWHYLLPLLEYRIGRIYTVLKKDWPFFYFRYISQKPDIIICVGIIGSFVCFFKKIRLVRSVIVNDWTDDWSEIMGRKYGFGLVSFLERYMIKNSDFIITPSKSRFEAAKKIGKKVFLRPHGTDMKSSSKSYKLKGGFKILYVGSQEKSKGVDALVRAVEGLDVELYLIGKIDESLRSTSPRN